MDLDERIVHFIVVTRSLKIQAIPFANIGI